MVAAAVLGVLQFLFGWLLFVFIGIGTLGIGFLLGVLTRVVVTALLLMATDKLSASLEIRGFKDALLGSVVITVISTIGQRMLG